MLATLGECTLIGPWAGGRGEAQVAIDRTAGPGPRVEDDPPSLFACLVVFFGGEGEGGGGGY